MYKMILSAFVFIQVSLIPSIVFADQTVGDLGENIADSGTGVAKGIMTIGFVGGLGFVIFGVFSLRAAFEQRQPKLGPSLQIVLGFILLGIGTFIAMGSTTIFGNNEAVGLQELGL